VTVEQNIVSSRNQKHWKQYVNEL